MVVAAAEEMNPEFVKCDDESVEVWEHCTELCRYQRSDNVVVVS